MTKPKMTTVTRITKPAGRLIVNTILNKRKSLTQTQICLQQVLKK